MIKRSFVKMHGLGNDFILFDYTDEPVAELGNPAPKLIQQLADRHIGVGCDQVLILEKAKSKEHAFHYRIFNADGSEVAQCGNGARCVARYAYDQKITQARRFTLSTQQGSLAVQLGADQQVTVNMGIPVFDPTLIPLSKEYTSANLQIKLKDKTFNLRALSLGNPHAILPVTNVAQAPVATLGAALSQHPAFPKQCNIGFAEVKNEQCIQLRVYERGVAETLACGSGACAAMIAAHQAKKVGNQVDVQLRGGTLRVQWKGKPRDPVLMTGPAQYVFTGTLAY